MRVRLRVRIKGAVQGVGFRPFVFRIAGSLNLQGWVVNDTSGVTLEVEGEKGKVDAFLMKLNTEKPPLARIYSQEVEFLEPIGYRTFEIRESEEKGGKEVVILPDIATCEECLREVFNPLDRRYRYPFTNCTNCGPRFTIIERLPYDRPNTTMKVFEMCFKCREEYEDPMDRRFHAQPNACPACGPWLTLIDRRGSVLGEGDEALRWTVDFIRKGYIMAVKGIGGFHLICDALNEKAVRTLRERKRRKEKPFAVMFRDLDQVEDFAQLTDLERSLITAPERPIVLVRKRKDLAPSVAPGLKRIGVFLPYTPLHHIILRELNTPVVATSGNLSEEPIVKDNREALRKLSPIADYILVHNREIKRRCDDSVVKVVGGIPTPIRRSRGYTPMPVVLPFRLRKKVLAVGGMFKNTFAIGFEDRVIMSQHVGDVDNFPTLKAFEESVLDLMYLYGFEPEMVMADLHPRYETTRWAEEFARSKGIPIVKVQHHVAHILSCMAEKGLKGEVLGIAWDGTGYGTDGTVWGGEFLIVNYQDFKRMFRFKPFRLIGGEKAVKEPRRVALSLILETLGEERARELMRGVFAEKELNCLITIWKKGLNSPIASSVGRLFDGVASLLGVKHKISFEGQAAMILEDMFDPYERGHYPYEIKEGEVDWRPTIVAILEDKQRNRVPSRFINTLARIIFEVVKELGLEDVCLSGGVFQNDPLVSRVRELLEGKGYRIHTHQKVPPNDGGIALGQAVYRNVG